MLNFKKVQSFKTLNQLAKSIDTFFSSIPKLPLELTAQIIFFLPTLLLAFGMLSVTFGTLVLINTPFISQAFLDQQFNRIIYTILTAMLTVANGVLMILTSPLVRKKLRLGWEYLLTIVMISFLQSILAFSFKDSGLIGTWVYGFIALYLVFQLKPSFYLKGE